MRVFEPQRREALERWLVAVSGAEDVSIVELRPLSGGAIQENWLLEVELFGAAGEGRQAYVLRSDAATAVAASLGRAQEFALLRLARAAGVAVPEPLWLCEDPTVLGRAFYVMRKVDGVAFGPSVVKRPDLGGDRESLAENLGRELAKIHAIAPPQPDLDFLGQPPARPALAAVALYRRWLDKLGVARPALEWGLRWCERQAPESQAVTLIHQDFRTGNYLLDATGLTAVLDWEFAAWGDPMSDLGWFCCRYWRFGRPDLAAGGIADRAPFYRGYEAASGRRVDPEVVLYWEVMAQIRWAVIALQQGARHTHGGEGSLDLALTGRVIAELEYELLAMTQPARWRAA
jgi:aminoglycoside phosphotransferase (APT) family kinase protein